MKKLAAFLHVFQTESGAFIYHNQIHRLFTSGLINELDYFYIGVSGNQKMFSIPKGAVVNYNSNSKDEGDTVIAAANFSMQNPNCKLLFLHTKGASRSHVASIEAWRLFMEYFVIDNWRTCVKELETYNAVGVKLRQKPLPHFSGNFWWANTNYLQKCNPSFLFSKGFECKVDRELWVGTGANFNPKDLHPIPENLSMHSVVYTEDNYVNEA